MAGRRTVDTSAMFKSMTGRTTPAPEQEPVVQPADPAPAVEEVKAPKKTEPAAKPKKPKTSEESAYEKKVGVRYTQLNSEAMELYKAAHFMAGRVDSKIINMALDEFLAKERLALSKVDKSLSGNDRLREAMKYLN